MKPIKIAVFIVGLATTLAGFIAAHFYFAFIATQNPLVQMALGAITVTPFVLATLYATDYNSKGTACCGAEMDRSTVEDEDGTPANVAVCTTCWEIKVE